MAIPLTIGDPPELVTIERAVWTKIFSNVNIGRVTRNYPSNLFMWITYVNVGADAPVGTEVPKWKVLNSTTFVDNTTKRDVYVYADSEISLDIIVEA